jgi:hypothetical protein
VFSVFCGSIFPFLLPAQPFEFVDASKGDRADAKMGTGSRFSEAQYIAAIDE